MKASVQPTQSNVDRYHYLVTFTMRGGRDVITDIMSENVEQALADTMKLVQPTLVIGVTIVLD